MRGYRQQLQTHNTSREEKQLFIYAIDCGALAILKISSIFVP